MEIYMIVLGVYVKADSLDEAKARALTIKANVEEIENRFGELDEIIISDVHREIDDY